MCVCVCVYVGANCLSSYDFFFLPLLPKMCSDTQEGQKIKDKPTTYCVVTWPLQTTTKRERSKQREKPPWHLSLYCTVVCTALQMLTVKIVDSRSMTDLRAAIVFVSREGKNKQKILHSV